MLTVFVYAKLWRRSGVPTDLEFYEMRYSGKEAFSLIVLMGTGTGLLFILRWFWWRINAFSELAAMVISLLVTITFKFILPKGTTRWTY